MLPPGWFFLATRSIRAGNTLTVLCGTNFFPRVGLAWDPEGKGNMTIRAAYGMYGDRAMMLAGTAMYFSAPFGNTVSVQGANLTDPWAGQPGGNPLPSLADLQGVGVYS